MGQALNATVSLVVVTALFAMIYKLFLTPRWHGETCGWAPC